MDEITTYDHLRLTGRLSALVLLVVEFAKSTPEGLRALRVSAHSMSSIANALDERGDDNSAALATGFREAIVELTNQM